MRGKSYLQIGSITMGIAGSIINSEFFEEYLGMRVESIDEVEIIRRMTEGIYDEAEYQKRWNGQRRIAPRALTKTPMASAKPKPKRKRTGNLSSR